MSSLEAILEKCGGVARGAGGRIMPFYCDKRHVMTSDGNLDTTVKQNEPGGIRVTLKGDASPLTEADMASHHFLVGALPVVLEGVPVVSEESYEAGAPSVSRCWMVDPLDGTKEFVKGTDEFTVNIALIEDGRPVLGVVYAPALRLSYYAAKGCGAWRQRDGEAAVRIGVRRADPEHLTIVASKDHAGPMVAELLARFKEPTLRSMGSSLKFCLVAAGEADVYLRDLPTMEWDTAAAQCVVEVAGGSVCTLDGKPLNYGKPRRRNPAVITVGDSKLDWRARRNE